MITFKSHPDNPGQALHLKILNSSQATNTLFLYKVTLTGSRNWGWIYLGDNYLASYSPLSEPHFLYGVNHHPGIIGV